MIKKVKFTNKMIGLGWLIFAGLFFWVNIYSIHSNHRESRIKHSSGLELVPEIPARDYFGDNLVTEQEFHDPKYPHRRIPLMSWGLYASSEPDGLVDIDNVTNSKARLEKDFLGQGYEEDLSMLVGETYFGNCQNGIFTMNYDGFNCCCAYATESCKGSVRASFGFPALPVDENGKRGALPGYVRAVIDARWFRSTIPGTQNKNRYLNKDVNFNGQEVQSSIKMLPNYMQWRYIINENFDPTSNKPEGLKNLVAYCKGLEGTPRKENYKDNHLRKLLAPNHDDPPGKDYKAYLPFDTPNGSPSWAPNPRNPFDSCIRPYDTKDVAGRRVASSELHSAYALADDYCFNKVPPVPHMSLNGLYLDKHGRHARWNEWSERYETSGIDSKTKEPFDHRFKVKHSDTYFHYRASLPSVNRYGYEFHCILEVARPFELEVRHVDPCPPLVKYSNRGRQPEHKNCVQSEGYEYHDTHNAYGPLYITKDSTKEGALRMAAISEYPPDKRPSYFGDDGSPNMNCVDTKRKCLKHDKWTKKCTADGQSSGDSSVVFPNEHEAKANAWHGNNIPAHQHAKCKPLDWDFFVKQYDN
ncbi:MAG: hypothetical protein KBF93_14730 [Leptospiraceae bacterium]|nr:hypothetical protein [Leptospiraceae bacterium]